MQSNQSYLNQFGDQRFILLLPIIIIIKDVE